MSFPLSPFNGQSATVNGITYAYDSGKNAWFRETVPLATLTISGNTTSGNITAGNITATSALYIDTGLFWSGNNQPVVSSGAQYTASSTPPSSPSIGDQWYKTTTDVLYQYINDGSASFWVDISTQTVTGSSSIFSTTNEVEVISPFLLSGL